MKIPKIFRRNRPAKIDPSLPVVVIFAGGMGTQIIQAAVYFSLKNAGRRVYADLSYFDTESRMAVAGNAGQLTHWFWQLDPFGLPKTAFEQDRSLNRRNADMLPDGPRMMELGLKALEQPEIKRIFKDVADVRAVLPPEVLQGFFCVHIRRGDYVNVASHLISDTEFVSLIKKFAGLTEHIVLLSDSPIPTDFRNAVTPLFKSALFLDNLDPYTSHQVMRCARILICSNSTFSLTGAALNPNPDLLVLMPQKWFGEKNREIEAPIHARCSFEVMR